MWGLGQELPCTCNASQNCRTAISYKNYKTGRTSPSALKDGRLFKQKQKCWFLEIEIEDMNKRSLLAFIQVGTARIEGTHVRRGWAGLEPRTLQSPGSALRIAPLESWCTIDLVQYTWSVCTGPGPLHPGRRQQQYAIAC